MRVLLTGAGGFVGRRLVSQRPFDWEIVTLSRQTLPDAPGVRRARMDRASDPLPELGAFDVIVHLAGNADHGLATREPWRDLEATGVTAAALLGRIPARRVVLLSSAAVYAGLEGLVGPALPVAPPMAYALSKLYVEGFVHALASTGRLESAITLRLYNCFGPGERPNRLVPRVAQAVRDRRPFMLTGDGSSLTDPLHVDDVVRALIAAASRPVEGRFDLCGGDPRPLIERVRIIGTELGQPDLPVEVTPRADETPIGFWSDPGPALAALELEPWTPFSQALRAYARESGWA
jgi:nucleoside-diphosphate-sugar epimerase